MLSELVKQRAVSARLVNGKYWKLEEKNGTLSQRNGL